MPRRIPVGHVDDLPPGDARIVALRDGREIAVFNVAGAYYAIDNLCPHAGGPLGKGTVEGTVVTCPWHCFKFELRDGVCTWSPKLRIQTYAVVVQATGVYVEVEGG